MEVLNPFRAKFFMENMIIYLHFISSLYFDMTGSTMSQGISNRDIDYVEPK